MLQEVKKGADRGEEEEEGEEGEVKGEERGGRRGARPRDVRESVVGELQTSIATAPLGPPPPPPPMGKNKRAGGRGPGGGGSHGQSLQQQQQLGRHGEQGVPAPPVTPPRAEGDEDDDLPEMGSATKSDEEDGAFGEVDSVGSGMAAFRQDFAPPAVGSLSRSPSGASGSGETMEGEGVDTDDEALMTEISMTTTTAEEARERTSAEPRAWAAEEGFDDEAKAGERDGVDAARAAAPPLRLSVSKGGPKSGEEENGEENEISAVEQPGSSRRRRMTLFESPSAEGGTGGLGESVPSDASCDLGTVNISTLLAEDTMYDVSLKTPGEGGPGSRGLALASQGRMLNRGRSRSPLMRDQSPRARDRSPLGRDRSPLGRDRSPVRRNPRLSSDRQQSPTLLRGGSAQIDGRRTMPRTLMPATKGIGYRVAKGGSKAAKAVKGRVASRSKGAALEHTRAERAEALLRELQLRTGVQDAECIAQGCSVEEDPLAGPRGMTKPVKGLAYKMTSVMRRSTVSFNEWVGFGKKLEDNEVDELWVAAQQQELVLDRLHRNLKAFNEGVRALGELGSRVSCDFLALASGLRGDETSGDARMFIQNSRRGETAKIVSNRALQVRDQLKALQDVHLPQILGDTGWEASLKSSVSDPVKSRREEFPGYGLCRDKLVDYRKDLISYNKKLGKAEAKMAGISQENEARAEHLVEQLPHREEQFERAQKRHDLFRSALIKDLEKLDIERAEFSEKPIEAFAEVCAELSRVLSMIGAK